MIDDDFILFYLFIYQWLFPFPLSGRDEQQYIWEIKGGEFRDDDSEYWWKEAIALLD